MSYRPTSIIPTSGRSFFQPHRSSWPNALTGEDLTRTQRLPLVARQSCQQEPGRARCPIKKWMRLSPPAQVPSKDLQNASAKSRGLKRRRPLWCGADRVIAEDGPDGPAKQLIGSLRVGSRGETQPDHALLA